MGNETQVKPVSPFLLKLLIVAGVLYVLASCYVQADLYKRMVHIEHAIDHLEQGHH